MSTNYNRIKVADLEKNQQNKILSTNVSGELEFNDPNVIFVNDLITGGTSKALTAEMGKTLDTKKVDKIAGKSLLSDTEIARLGTLSNYTHPSNHAPSIIAQDPNNRFVTDAEKAAWNTKQAAGNYEPAFTKNTAFNKNFGTTSGTVPEGNDARISNGQTAFGWGNHSGLYPTLTGNGASGNWNINTNTATKLQTARTINGVAFDGSTNITIATNDTDKVPHQDGTRSDLNYNTALNSGFYNINATGTNGPGTSYNNLITVRGIDTGLQIAGGYTTDALWFRGWGSSGVSFTPWRKLLHDGNYAAYSTFSGVVSSGNGFQTSAYVLSTRNRIWSFGNSDGHGLSYFQGTAGWKGTDSIGFHFGNPTDASSLFKISNDGATQGLSFKTAANASGKSLLITGTSSADANTATIYVSNGNLHIDPTIGSALYLGYYSGTGTNFGNGANTVTANISAAGAITGASLTVSGDVTAFSDARVKENIRPIANVIERIQASRGIIYDRIDTKQKNNIGFIAQELEETFPELVLTREDGTKAVKYQNAVAILFEAIKSQQTQIEKQQQIIKEQNDKIKFILEHLNLKL